jgi:hypothetical protein
VKHLGVTRSTNPTQQPAGLPIPTAAVDRLWRQQATAPTHLRRLLERHRTLVGWQSQSSRVPSDRLDDQTDDQAAGHRVLADPDHGDYWWSGHQIFQLVTAGGLRSRGPPHVAHLNGRVVLLLAGQITRCG